MDTNETLHPLAGAAGEIRKRRYRLDTRRGYISLLENLLLMIAVILIAFNFVFFIATARGTNMYPAVLDGDIVFGYRLDHDYVKDDVVVCMVDGRQLIARVAAKGGDSVNITEEGLLYVNGTLQTGEIAFPTMPGKQEYPYTVPQGCLYLLGDYRTRTYDSRDCGAVDEADVIAKVVCIFRRRGI
ncbi:MAG: signal peptidase I [Lachnospiraceae bacterium]|nr:signal peptidase I [Lachnospiraceae bacterium]